jgi:hypothetical protein
MQKYFPSHVSMYIWYGMYKCLYLFKKTNVRMLLGFQSTTFIELTINFSSKHHKLLRFLLVEIV